MRHLLALALLLGLPLGAAAQSALPAFGPGEVLVYDLKYGPLHTGEARILVGSDTSEGRETWPIVLEARTNAAFDTVYSVRDRFVTQWDPALAESHGWDLRAREGGKRKRTLTRLDPAEGKATVTRQRAGSPPSEDTYALDGARHDITSALFWLRGRPLKVGDQEKVRIFTGRKVWDLVATVEGTEPMKGPDGEKAPALKVRLKTAFDGELAARRDIVVWMTNDLDHVPLRIEADLLFGSLRAELSSWLPGRSP